MSLQDLHHALVRLYTDRAFRAAFAEAPQNVLAWLDLDPEEQKILLHVSLDEVGEFARSLSNKRRNGLQECFPVTLGYLGEHFPALVDRFLELYPLRPGRRDEQTTSFVSYLDGCVRMYPQMPPALLAVCVFEQLLAAARAELRWARGTGAVDSQVAALTEDSVVWCPPQTRIGQFAYDVLAIAAGEVSLDAPPNTTSLLVTTALRRPEPTVLQVSPQVVEVVDALRAPMMVRTLVDRLGTAQRQSTSVDVLTTPLAQLVAAGVIVHLPGDSDVASR